MKYCLSDCLFLMRFIVQIPVADLLSIQNLYSVETLIFFLFFFFNVWYVHMYSHRWALVLSWVQVSVIGFGMSFESTH